MKQYTYEARLVSSKEIAEDGREFTFALDEPFIFKPGQYVWLELPSQTIADPRGNRRAFSVIRSSPEQYTVSVALRRSESGFKRSLFALPEGERVRLHGPFGSSFVLEEQQPPRLCIIAGGLGVSPFMEMLRQEPDLECLVVLLNKDGKAAAYADEVRALAGGLPRLQFLPSFELFSWEMVRQFANGGEAQWWVSGPQGLINHVSGVLQGQGIPRAAMRFECAYPQDRGGITEADIEKFKRESGSLGLLALEQSSQHTIITDVNGFILFANKAAQRITGYTLEEMRGHTPRLWGGAMGPEFYRTLWRDKLAGKPFSGEIRNRRKNGEVYHAIAHFSPILEGGRVIGYVATEEDITERVQLEERLQAQNRQILEEKIKENALLQSIGDGVVALDNEGRIIMVNDMAERMFGFERQELLGRMFADALPARTLSGEPLSRGEEPAERTLCTLQLVKETYLYAKRNGTTFAALVTMTPVFIGETVFGVITVVRDVTQERQVDRAKTEFVSLASHQLRTPLSVINWYAEILLAGDAGALTEEQRSHVEEIHRGNLRMVELVNALLDVSRLDLGTFTIEPEPTDIAEVSRTVVRDLQQMIEGKRLAVMQLYPASAPLISIDPRLTRIILQNLLSNAVKYTPERGRVTITVDFSDKRLSIAVADTGYGIPKDQQERIFSKFFRADNVRQKDTDGTGLGLYIVRAVVERSGGNIYFDSEEGKGSTFTVILPVRGAGQEETPPRARDASATLLNNSK